MYRFPDITDEKFMTKVYKKKEFYDNKADKPPKFKSSEEKVKFIQTVCNPINYDIQPHQALLSSLMHPNTPYKGMLVYHGLGTGKTCAAFAVAENFKEQVLRYETKIYIVVPGKDVKNNWKSDILDVCGKSIYMNTNHNAKLEQLKTENERKKALRKLGEVYKFVTYDKLRRMVIGEKGENMQGEKVYRLDTNSLQKLDNSLIIVDEAHNIAGSERGKALQILIHNSTNLRVLLLSATPMRNVAEDIIPLLNYLRPIDEQILKDDVFENSDKVLDMKLKPNGLEIIKQSSRGYISYFKSANPILYPQIEEMGVTVSGIDMKLVRCQIDHLQKNLYINFVENNTKALTSLDSLANAQALSNFVFPILDKDKKSLIGISSHKGLVKFRNQMQQHPELLKKAILKKLELKKLNITVTQKHRIIGGDLLNIQYLGVLSSKYHTLLKTLLSMGPGTSFIYSNFVEIGIQIVEEILLENGFLEYGNNQITSKTRCSYCGKMRSDLHSHHTFTPAKFFTFTGQMFEKEGDRGKIIPIFNESQNVDGSVIKFLLGSQVLSEGVNLKSVRTVHIMDAHLNLSRINQAVGRAVRYCSAVNLVSVDNPTPMVKVYKYAASYGSKLSLEESIYRHAEIKYKLIQQINTTLQSVAVDCPLNYETNQVECDGAGDLWNGNQYKQLTTREIDKNTYHVLLAEKEIRNITNKIKTLFVRRLHYTLREIKIELKSTIENEFFLYRALEALTPITDEQKNTYSEVFVDNYNRLGYLIYRSGHYIFQQWMAEEYMPTYYRERPPVLPSTKTSLTNFLMQMNYAPEKDDIETLNDFESNRTYYQQYPEGEYVGIIELQADASDVFKIRVRQKQSDFRRGKGIVSYKGAVCEKKSITWLLDAAKNLGITIKDRNSRPKICNQLKDKLIQLEATEQMTYVILPANHPKFPIKKRVKA